MKKVFLGLIFFYKKALQMLRILRVPGFLYTDCKFYPSCSDYAIGAVNKYGPIRGLARASLRVLRCSPFSKGGVDMP